MSSSRILVVVLASAPFYRTLTTAVRYTERSLVALVLLHVTYSVIFVKFPHHQKKVEPIFFPAMEMNTPELIL